MQRQWGLQWVGVNLIKPQRDLAVDPLDLLSKFFIQVLLACVLYFNSIKQSENQTPISPCDTFLEINLSFSDSGSQSSNNGHCFLWSNHTRRNSPSHCCDTALSRCCDAFVFWTQSWRMQPLQRVFCLFYNSGCLGHASHSNLLQMKQQSVPMTY